MALAFTRSQQSSDDGRLREVLALSIDRTALSNVLLQGGGEPAGGILLELDDGLCFLLFPATADLAAARQARLEARSRLGA